MYAVLLHRGTQCSQAAKHDWDTVFQKKRKTMVNVASKTLTYFFVILNLFLVSIYFSHTFSIVLFSGSFLLFSELDLLLLLLLLLEEEELEEDLESCLLKLSFDTVTLDTSIS